MEDEKRKRCGRCKDEKPLGDFYGSRTNRDGRQNNCKACSREVVNEWQRNNRDKTNNVSREKRSADMREWYEANRERHVANVIRYNKEKYHSDPFYKLSKEIYHLVHRYNKKIGSEKFGPTFKMLGTSAEETHLYFREAIDALTAAGKKHRVEQVVPTKYFVYGCPVDVVYGLLNLRIVDRDARPPVNGPSDGCLIVSPTLFVAVERFVKPECRYKLMIL